MLEKLKKIDFIELLIFLMPFIDVLNTISGFSLSLLYRGFFLAFILFIFLFKNKSKLKKGSFCLLFLIFCFSFVFLFNYYLVNGLTNLFKEVSSLVKFIYLPIVTVCLVNYYDSKDLKINEIMIKLAWIYIAFLILPSIFGISNNSYDYGKKGLSGLFYAPNEIGAILAILSPFVIYNIQKDKNKFLNILLGILFIITAFLLGTKTPVIGLFISLLHVLIVSIIRMAINKNNFKNIIINICLITFSILIYHNSYLIFNINYQNNNYNNNTTMNSINNIDNINFYNFDKLYENEYLINFPTSYNKNDLKEIDNKLLNIIFSSRNIYMVKSLNDYKNSSNVKKLIGLSFYGETNNEAGKLTELDFVDILVNYGITGTLILSLYIIIIAIAIFIKFMKKFNKNIIDDELCSTYLSFLIAFLIALTAGHTMGAPAVSTLVSLTIVYLIKRYNLFKINYIGGFLICLIGALYVIFTISYLLLPLGKIINIKIDDDIHFENEVKLIENQKISYNNIEDELEFYMVKGYNHFKIIYVKRTLSNNDQITFLTFTNEEDKNVLVNIEFANEKENYLKNDNGLLLENNKVLLSNSYHYNKAKNNINLFNQNVAKNLLNKQYDYTIIDNKIKKSFSIKSNTSVDSFVIKSQNELINQNEIIPWLSYNGIYENYNDYYLRDFANQNFNNYEANINNILLESYLMSLYKYTNNYNNFWYQDYELINQSNINHQDIYLDLNYNYSIYKNIELFNSDNLIYQQFADTIINEYNKNNYLITNKGIIFNSVETTFDNQIGILNILIDYYVKNNSAHIKTIIDKLLNELINDEWLIGDKDIHSYITNELSYNGLIKDSKTLISLLNLKDNLNKIGINKKEIDNYINILYNKFENNIDQNNLNILMNNY